MYFRDLCIWRGHSGLLRGLTNRGRWSTASVDPDSVEQLQGSSSVKAEIKGAGLTDSRSVGRAVLKMGKCSHTLCMQVEHSSHDLSHKTYKKTLSFNEYQEEEDIYQHFHSFQSQALEYSSEMSPAQSARNKKHAVKHERLKNLCGLTQSTAFVLFQQRFQV